MEEGKCRLLSLSVSKEFEERQLLGSQTSVDPGGGNGGEGGPGSVGEDEATGSSEGGGCGSSGDEERLSGGHAQEADGQSDSE